MRRALGCTGGRRPGPAPHWSSPRRGGAAPGPGHLESPLRREIGGWRARAPRGKGVRRKGPGPRPSSLRPALPCPPPWRRPRSDAPCARPARRKLCPAKSPARLTAQRGAWYRPRAPPGPRKPARDCRGPPASGARRAPPCASGRQNALRGPLGEPGFVGEPNFTLHFHLRLCLGDLAATDLVRQKLHQEVRKSELRWGCTELAGEPPAGGRSVGPGVPGVSDPGIGT